MKIGEYLEPMACDIAFWIMGANDPGYPLNELGELSLELSDKLRGMAIALLLTEGSPDAFCHNLIRSGGLREFYLRRCAAELRFDDYHRTSGRYEPLLDAIAAGDFELARRIVELSPSDWFSEREYEDDYCYAQILHRWVLGGSTEIEIPSFLGRFEAFVGGSNSRLDVCHALTTRDQQGFEEAFDTFLEARREEIGAAKARGQLEEPPIVAQRFVFIEGLALLRIAVERGLVTRSDYPMCPSLARVPMTKPYPGF